MLRKRTSKTVSEKILDLFASNTDGDDGSTDEQSEEPRVEKEFDEYELPDARTSDIRKLNVKLLSEQSVRYRGKISSRKELEEELVSKSLNEEGTEVEDEFSDNEDAVKSFAKRLTGTGHKITTNESDMEGFEPTISTDDNEQDTDQSDDSEEFSDNGIESEDGDIDGIESEDDENADGTDIIAESNHQAEVQKSHCIRNQLQIWESLLELRIHIQKFFSKSNQLLAPHILREQQKENEKLANLSRESVNAVSTLLSSMLQLQNTLCSQFSEQSIALKKSLKRPLIVHDPEKDDATPTKRFADHINANFEAFKTYRNAVLLKWDDRTKLLTTAAGRRKSLAEDYNIIRKIESTLQNRHALIEKAHTLKNSNNSAQQGDAAEDGDAVSDTPKPEYIAELYDDSDFYHQQLRELIEYKTSISVSAKEVTQQYMELQKLRQKMKKNVDTRASKGRKLRYTVHNKLINFMAPDDTSTWTEESKDELYRSLFAA